MKLKSTLKGSRITLKRTKPGNNMAKKIFALVDKNREHLRPWLPWVDGTKTIQDTIEYLASKEKDFEAGKKIEYGIYIGSKYIGNIGMFSLNWADRSGEIGYWIDADYQGQGYMTEAVQVLEKYFFEERELNRIVIRCSEYNHPSNQVAKKCQYVFEGKFRQASYSMFLSNYYDIMLYSKLQEDYKFLTSGNGVKLLEKWIEEKRVQYPSIHSSSFTRIYNALRCISNNSRPNHLYNFRNLTEDSIIGTHLGTKTTTLLFKFLEEDGIILKEK